MPDQVTGCIICGAPLIYSRIRSERRCAICGRARLSDAQCEKGHFVCDECHSRESVTTIAEKCMTMDSTDPVGIFLELVGMPGVHMHGPEHHVIVGSALLTAVRNTGEEFDLETALNEMESRGKQVPGGICGFWGTCGAAVSCGIACSIMMDSTPLSDESWGLSNLMTSRCLEAIGRIGGPRCCKRDGITALVEASRFLKEVGGIELDIPRNTSCSFSNLNKQCIGERCPYHE